MEQHAPMPVINAGSLQVSIINSDLYASLSPYARDCLTVLLWDIHPNEWRDGGKPISRLRRYELANTVNACLKTVQRALAELEAAGFVVRLFNDFHHATGVDLRPMVRQFYDIKERAQKELRRRKKAREDARAARDHSKALLAAAEKNLARTIESTQMDTDAQSTTNPLSEVYVCTGLENGTVENPDGGSHRAPPYPVVDDDEDREEPEKLLELPTMRFALMKAHPRYGEILADNTESGDAKRATLDDMIAAADVLRQEIGFRRNDWDKAVRRHGLERSLAYFVTMSSPAARLLREIRNTQGYIIGGFKKPPHEFRPFRSMWKLIKEMDSYDSMAAE